MVLFVLYKLKSFTIHLFRTTTKAYLQALCSQNYRLLKFIVAHLKVTASFVRLCVFSISLPVLFQNCLSLMYLMYFECLDLDVISKDDSADLQYEDRFL